MHATEAFLALADVTGDTAGWPRPAHRRALIHAHAAANGYMVIEHFDRDWQPLRDYNRDNPADGFRPYGTTPGHGFEWARLLLHLEAARLRAGLPRRVAGHRRKSLFEQRLPPRLGRRWRARHRLHPGLGQPPGGARAPALDPCRGQRRRQRLAQAHRRAQYEHWYRCFWDFCDAISSTAARQLAPRTRPAQPAQRRIWGGKPDLYHAWQAVLLPRLPLRRAWPVALAFYVTMR
jgi:mannose/cellobiose epimerase-like protein (N-acyl-D-glucosamine 2-epimerase family)